MRLFSRRNSFPFNTLQGIIIVPVEVWGPEGSYDARLALDTGATGTSIRTSILVATGYDPERATEQVRMTTGSGVEVVPRLPVTRLETLGQARQNFPVIAHTLPSTVIVDGLLGLDFFRNQELRLDFRKGRISLH